MKKMRHYLSILMAAAMIFTLCSACGDSGNSNGSTGKNNSDASGESSYEKVTLTFSNPYLESTPHGIALNYFADYVSEKSGGNVKIDVFHNADLGPEAEADKGVLNGSIDMTFSGTSGIGNTIPATACIECFFNFDSIDKVVEMENILHEDLKQAFTDVGMEYLGLYIDGPRMILSKTPITSIDDFQNFKMRLPTATIYINDMAALGANGVVMTLNDTYTGLQTGAVEGTEGALTLLFSQKHYEQAQYLTRSDHVWQGLYIYANAAKWNQLEADTQALIREALEASQSILREEWEKDQTELLAAMEAEGVTVLELTDREKWVEAVQQANYDYCADAGELGLKMYKVLTELQDN